MSDSALHWYCETHLPMFRGGRIDLGHQPDRGIETEKPETARAIEAGHTVLVRSDPRNIPRIVSLARTTYRKILQNLWRAAGYNIFAIPHAAGVLAAWAILLTPALGAVLISASTVIVAINAQFLKRAGL